MSVCSIGFLLVCAGLAIALYVFPDRLPRRVFFAAANLGFLAAAVPNKRAAFGLAVFVVATYAALRLVKARPTRNVVLGVVAVGIAAFLVLKRYEFLLWMLPESVWAKLPEVIGISYMLFKFIHMVVDQSQGQLEPFSFASYANYQLSFFTILAGPIQRYNDFQRFWDAPALPIATEAEALDCWNRLLTGMIKVGVLAPIAWDIFVDGRTHLLGSGSSETGVPRQFAAFFYAYPVFLYLNFSGYTDVVVAAAKLVGMKLPENFNKPYLARNVIDFWNRWHISLTHWIRDYVFMIGYKAAVERYPKSGKKFGLGLLFLSLFLAGVWHGSTFDYVVFGTLHGLAVATNQGYGEFLSARLGRERYKRYQKNVLIQWVAVLVTFHYVCFCMTVFSSGYRATLTALGALVRSLPVAITTPPSPVSLALLALVPLALWASWKREALVAFFERTGKRLTSKTGPFYAVVLTKAAFVTLVLISLWALEKEPEIAYMRF